MSRSIELATDLSDEQPAMPPNRKPDEEATAPDAMMPFMNARLEDLLRGPTMTSPSASSEFELPGIYLLGFFIVTTLTWARGEARCYGLSRPASNVANDIKH
jgi:hypothetical protein